MFGLPAWLLVVPVVGFLIFVHELGHFITAKRFGIKVAEFGFGFPPRIFGVRYGETIYSINWIPLGGFVRMVGEEDPTEPRSFARQSVYKRAVVLVSGSLVNLLVPVVIFTILFMLPHNTLVRGDVVITGVAPGSPAKEAGLRSGDTIVSVAGERVMTPGELVGLIRDKRGRPVELSVRRGSLIPGLGSSVEYSSVETVQLVPRSKAPDLKVVREVTDPSTEASLTEARRYDARLKIGDTITQSFIGVMIGVANARVEKTTDPIWEAVPNSFTTIWDVLVFTKNGIVDSVSTGSNPGLVGPVGIAQATGEGVSRFGFSWVFQLMALISISLGIVNMLPIPALDGGRLVFVLIEWARGGKRISPQREGLVHLIGFAVLLSFIVAISYFDIIRILNGDGFVR